MSGIAYCGIDFGVDCTNVAICSEAFPVNNGDPLPFTTRPVPDVAVNVMGERSTPTWVQCPKNEEEDFVIGLTARDQARRCEDRTVSAIKVALGNSVNSSKVQEAIESKVWTCDVVDNNQKEASFSIQGKKNISATDLATKVIKQLLEDVSSGSGKDVKGCVLAVHPNATESENNALVAAAKKAGFEQVTMLTSDVAVALAYGFDKMPDEDTEEETEEVSSGETKGETKGEIKADEEEDEDDDDEEEKEEEVDLIVSPSKRMLVLDIGASSSTASLLLCTNGLFQSIKTVTQNGVGGWFIDESLVKFCSKQFQRSSKIDITNNTQASSKLRSECQKAKLALSTAKDTMLGVEALAEGVDFRMRLNAARYEAECGDAMLATLGPINTLLQELKLTVEDIDRAVSFFILNKTFLARNF
jgi:molecular chaperone DnaK (HSP70)